MKEVFALDQNQENTTHAEDKKPAGKYVGFSIKQRIAPTVLLAVALGVTICLIGPYDIFFNNIDEFLFSAMDFALWNIVYTLVLIGAVCGILLPLRGRWFDVSYAILFAVTIMLFVQGNYLNGNMSSLAGDGVGETVSALGPIIVNGVVWLLVASGCVTAILLLKQSYREWIGTVGCIAMVMVIGMQLIPLFVSALSIETPEKEELEWEESFLTYENLTSIAKENNVFYFVVDRFDASYYEDYAAIQAPELFEGLDGFTYYSDMISLYPRTFPSMPYLFTGVEHDFTDKRLDYFKDAYSNSDFLDVMKAEGYKINYYTDDYYAYEDASDMSEYVSNRSSNEVGHRTVKKMNLSWDMLRISFYRYFPFFAKSWVGNISTPTFQKYVEYDSPYPKYKTDMRDVYTYLQENELHLSDEKKTFSVIHLEGCHQPHLYNENFEPAKTSEEQLNPTVGVKQSFKIINMYISKLKELGLYEDATIIISGDHGSLRWSDTTLLNDPSKSGAFLTAFFFKPSGSSGTPLAVSTAPLAQADVIPSIIQSEGIETNIDFGTAISEVSEGDVRERWCVFHSLRDGNNYKEYVYRIVGSGKDLNNWVIANPDQEKFVGDIYD